MKLTLRKISPMPNEDPTVAVIAAAIILLAIAYGVIHGQVKRQQKEAECSKEYHRNGLAIGSPEALSNQNTPALAETNDRDSKEQNSKVFITYPHSAIAIWTEALTKWTFILAGAGMFAAIFAWWTLNAIRGQLEEMRQDRRPWMQGSIQFTGPLVFDKDGARVPIRLSLRNSGRSPARSVWRGIRVFAGDSPDTRIIAWEDDLCRHVVRDIGKGFTVFPDEPPGGSTFSVTMNGSDVIRNVDTDGGIILHMIVCIDYTEVDPERETAGAAS